MGLKKKKTTESISPEIRNETRLSTLPTLIQYSALILSYRNKAREGNKRDTNRK
jgi:hypothetical protein